MGCCGCTIPEKSGLKKRRGLTDALCVVFFMICVVVWVAVGTVAFFLGSPLRYWNGFDSYGNTCNSYKANKLVLTNVTNSGIDTAGLKNVLFFDKVGQSALSLSICVAECPLPLNNRTEIASVADFIEYTMATKNLLCDYSVPLEKYQSLVAANFSRNGPCPKFPIYRSIALVNRCIPMTASSVDVQVSSRDLRLSSTSQHLDALQNFITGTLVDLLFEFLNQAYSNEVAIVAACVSAIALSIFMMLMMHCLAYVFTYFILFGVILGTFALAVLAWLAYTQNYRVLDAIPIPSFVDTQAVFLALGIICTCAALLILFLVMFLWRRILLVCAIFREITRCLSDEPAMILLPFKQIFLIASWLILSVIVYFSMLTTDNYFINGSGYVEFTPNVFFRYFLGIHSVMVVWIFFFIIGIQNMTTAACTTVWYFTPKRVRGRHSALMVGSHLAWCYHIGSVALASFVHTLFFALLLALKVLMLLVKKKSKDNKALNCCLKCFTCCVACIWRIYGVINDYAYAFIAMYGKNFCPAANMAFQNVVRNPLHVASIASIGSACIFLCQILVASATTACTELYLIKVDGKTAEQTWFCAVLIFFVSFLIASIIFDLYGDMLYTLFVCFVRDTEDNDGSFDRPFYMSRSLMKFIEDVNHKVYENDEPLSWGTMAREHNPMNRHPNSSGEVQEYDVSTLMAKCKTGYFQRE